MRIYLAARYTRRLELCEYRAQLEELGCTITSRWLNGSHQISNQGVPIGDSGELLVEKGDREAREMCEHFAKEDREDVYAADIVIAFTEESRSGHSRGGRHVELGLAIARGKRIYIVGPRENVFCWLPELTHFSEWPLMRGEIVRLLCGPLMETPRGDFAGRGGNADARYGCEHCGHMHPPDGMCV